MLNIAFRVVGHICSVLLGTNLDMPLQLKYSKQYLKKLYILNNGSYEIIITSLCFTSVKWIRQRWLFCLPSSKLLVQGELEQRVPSELSGRGLKLPCFVYVHT